jgi:hypothetical protein
MTGGQAKKFEILAEQLLFGQITRQNAVLKLRGGTDYDGVIILAFILLINLMDEAVGFQCVSPPNVDPLSWLFAKSNKKPNYKSSKFELQMAGINDNMCPSFQLADENGYLMTYEEALNLVTEKYLGYIRVNYTCKISDWQAAKHIYHGTGMGVDPLKRLRKNSG